MRPAAAGALAGRVRVIDDDTIVAIGVHVCLQGVAAPEIAHPGLSEAEPDGEAACAFLRRLAEGRSAACELTRERTHGRRVGVCRMAGLDCGEAVVAAGLARDCPRYSGGRYAAVERPGAAALPLPAYCAPR
jgi:endonuclease YncB( thermonuclease family)